jgi:hypothetical protein
MGTANIAIAVLGLCYVIPAENLRNVSIILVVFFLNMLVGSYVYVDAFVRTLPGITKKQKGQG